MTLAHGFIDKHAMMINRAQGTKTTIILEQQLLATATQEPSRTNTFVTTQEISYARSRNLSNVWVKFQTLLWFSR